MLNTDGIFSLVKLSVILSVHLFSSLSLFLFILERDGATCLITMVQPPFLMTLSLFPPHRYDKYRHGGDLLLLACLSPFLSLCLKGKHASLYIGFIFKVQFGIFYDISISANTAHITHYILSGNSGHPEYQYCRFCYVRV